MDEMTKAEEALRAAMRLSIRLGEAEELLDWVADVLTGLSPDSVEVRQYGQRLKEFKEKIAPEREEWEVPDASGLEWLSLSDGRWYRIGVDVSGETVLFARDDGEVWPIDAPETRVDDRLAVHRLAEELWTQREFIDQVEQHGGSMPEALVSSRWVEVG